MAGAVEPTLAPDVNAAPPAPIPLLAVAPLLLTSGFCALTYQVAWTRGFRLIFGASTAASAAVLAAFMGGLGFGAWWLGRRADRSPRPLLLYAVLEGLVAVFAAASPGFMALAGRAYLRLGGSMVLGHAVATLACLVLAAAVMLPATVLAGGTFGAAARSAESESDPRRRRTALLYGVNTLGAVIGCLSTTFFLLESLGTRATLWTASAVNLAVALIAAALSVRRARLPPSSPFPAAATADGPSAPAPFVLAAAAVVGFAFFLMELVWYRMLGPILGGTVYTFGLVLAMALAGIALGGILYSAARRRRTPDLHAFAMTCVGEAALIALPYVLGDRLALLTIALFPPAGSSLWAHVTGWSVIAFIVVFFPAVVAGVQFPLLIALLGSGRQELGRHVGLAYLSNTLGAVAGALAGGFGLLPLLSAPGCWRAVALLLCGTALFASLLARGDTPRRLGTLVAASAVAAILFISVGPTAAWRHSGIGIHGIELFGASPGAGRNAAQAWLNASRRAVIWERDGVESSLALNAQEGLAFVVNGKIDGNARQDAPTQVMGGLLGALLRPAPTRTAFIVGLGTGSTAGWLGALPEMQRTDVVELEPAMLQVARACAPVNRDVLHNPRVRVLIGDAREVLTTTPERYDLVFSEPSNPYRAGIASLFTREFYRSAAERLTPDGVFLQWLQAYAIDGQTVATILATLADVFPEVEIWQTHDRDLLLVGSKAPLAHDLPGLAARMGQEPYATALRVAWRATDVHEVLGRFVGGPAVARHFREAATALNTDDVNRVEFSFARTVSSGPFEIEQLRGYADRLGASRLPMDGVDWDRVRRHRLDAYTISHTEAALPSELSPAQRAAAQAQILQARGDLLGALRAFQALSRAPRGLLESALFAEGLAEAGDLQASGPIADLAQLLPAEADAAAARLALRRGRPEVAAASLVSAFSRYRTDPWPDMAAMNRALELAAETVTQRKDTAPPLFEALREPFAVRALDEARIHTRLRVAAVGGLADRCVEALSPLEPHIPWREDVLKYRAECYRFHHHPHAEAAAADLARFLRDATPAASPKPVGSAPGH